MNRERVTANICSESVPRAFCALAWTPTEGSNTQCPTSVFLANHERQCIVCGVWRGIWDGL